MSDEQFIVNPKTNRKVKVGSAVWKKLKREGLVSDEGVQSSQYVKKQPQESEGTPTSEESSEELVPEQPKKEKKPRKKKAPEKVEKKQQ